MATRIAVLVGSKRKESLNRKMAQTLIALAPGSLDMDIVDIGHLPLYDEDEDVLGVPPPAWAAFRRQIRNYDGLLFVTPEYNRSVPAVLKNALDIGSRPCGENVWDGKPGAVISLSASPLGVFGSSHHIRQSLVYLNVPCMQQPETAIATVNDIFDPQGRLSNESLQQFLRNFMRMFAQWVQVKTRPCTL